MKSIKKLQTIFTGRYLRNAKISILLVCIENALAIQLQQEGANHTSIVHIFQEISAVKLWNIQFRRYFGTKFKS